MYPKNTGARGRAHFNTEGGRMDWDKYRENLKRALEELERRNEAIRADNARRRAIYEARPDWVVVDHNTRNWIAYHKTDPRYAAALEMKRAERSAAEAAEIAALRAADPVESAVDFLLDTGAEVFTRADVRAALDRTGAKFTVENLQATCKRLQSEGMKIK